ncbi:MAG TPA: HlyD family efflux transporter periplasmic adaptor subunit [Pirellulales bacterium]|jgi:multidrug resistance efflux pump|nr:HlyD family efflux transporter periplasmic adaptor subunit [Pirellulales bacterium]
MAITIEDRAVSQHPEDRFTRPSPRRNRSGWLPWVLAALGVLVTGGGLYAAYTYLYQGRDGTGDGHVVTASVKKGDLVITVTEDGNVESANNVELKCKVPGPITILEIVPDGSHVKKGDQLVLLDSSSIEDSILTQEIAVAKAEAAKITSEKDFSAAKIGVSEYEQGTLRRDVRRAEADIIVAKQNLSTAENQLRYSRNMYRKGYVTQLDVESKEFALEQAELDVEVAELSKEVLQKFTSAKTLEELKSKRDSAEALMNSDVAAFTKESNQLKRLKDQLAECTITAPQDGMVVYANDRSNPFQQTPKVDLGAQVNQFQAIVRLPDLKSMQVKALVHESKVDQLRLGMRAKIKIQDRDFQGEITSISNQPEATMWFQGNSKEYATLLKIDGEPTELKPGMTAEIEILVSQKKGVLQVPVQCVIERGGKFRSYVKTPNGVTARDLALGGTNDTVIEIVDGLKEGELVLLNPRADEPDATEKIVEAEAVDVDKQYGASQAKPAPAAAGPAGTGATPATGSAAGATGGPPSTGGSANAQAAATEGGQTSGTAPAAAAPAGAGAPAGPAAIRWPTFKEADKNGDGKISRDETTVPAMFDQTDTNSDGGIDPKEFKTAIDKFKKMLANQAGGGLPGGSPPNQ